MTRKETLPERARKAGVSVSTIKRWDKKKVEEEKLARAKWQFRERR